MDNKKINTGQIIDFTLEEYKKAVEKNAIDYTSKNLPKKNKPSLSILNIKAMLEDTVIEHIYNMYDKGYSVEEISKVCSYSNFTPHPKTITKILNKRIIDDNIKYYSNGKDIESITYIKINNIHNESIIETFYQDTGNLRSITYIVRGKISHLRNKPSKIEYFDTKDNNIIMKKYWHVKGLLHKIIKYDRTGNIIEKAHFINGVPNNKNEKEPALIQLLNISDVINNGNEEDKQKAIKAEKDGKKLYLYEYYDNGIKLKEEKVIMDYDYVISET